MEKELLLSHSCQPSSCPSLQPEPKEKRGLAPCRSALRRPHHPAPAIRTPGKAAKQGSYLPANAGAGASRPCYRAGFGPRLQVGAPWSQRYSSPVPSGMHRNPSCPPLVVLFRLAQKSQHKALGAQAVWPFGSHRLLLRLPRPCACICEASEFVVTAPSPRTTLKREGTGLPFLCSCREAALPPRFTGVFLQGVCCTIERSVDWQYRLVESFSLHPWQVYFDTGQLSREVTALGTAAKELSGYGQVSALLWLPTEFTLLLGRGFPAKPLC